ncbi:MAG: flagellar basal body protein [Desulfosudis oleivorans]|nr:flagellar basal body protein [Desulfosudis oleivorans]
MMKLNQNQLLYSASAEIIVQQARRAEERHRRHQVMDLFTAMDISASGLRAQRTTMNVISSNIANAHTTRTA